MYTRTRTGGNQAKYEGAQVKREALAGGRGVKRINAEKERKFMQNVNYK